MNTAVTEVAYLVTGRKCFRKDDSWMAITETHEQFASGMKVDEHRVIDVFNNALDEILSTA
jgi:hypothetical protein